MVGQFWPIVGTRSILPSRKGIKQFSGKLLETCSTRNRKKFVTNESN
jgi:hypothetical protein